MVGDSARGQGSCPPQRLGSPLSLERGHHHERDEPEPGREQRREEPERRIPTLHAPGYQHEHRRQHVRKRNRGDDQSEDDTVRGYLTASSIVFASDTLNSPGASTFSTLTTPSSA